MPDEPADAVVLTFIPSLIALLLAAERDKGDALTEGEVLAIRDGAACIALPPPVAERTAEQRGYDDVDPEQVWEQWQAVRREMEPGSDEAAPVVGEPS